jgi:creatinine amidohydrolase
MPTLATTSWTAAQALNGRVLVIPIGATEQHGPHLPLTTDSDIAVALADGLLATLPDAIVVAPVIAFGASGEHQDFAGTLSIGQAAIEHVVIELGRSATCTWPRVLLLSTHGGNLQAVRRAERCLRDEGREVRVWVPNWAGDAHAGQTETSLMLAIDPARVRLWAAEPGATEPIGTLMPRLAAAGVAGVSGNGVLGDPAGASALEGRRLLDAAVTSLASVVMTWQDGTARDGRAA